MRRSHRHAVRSKSNQDAVLVTAVGSTATGVRDEGGNVDVNTKLSNSLATWGRSEVDPVDSVIAEDAAGMGMPSPGSGIVDVAVDVDVPSAGPFDDAGQPCAWWGY